MLSTKNLARVAAIGVVLIAIPPQKEDEKGDLAQTIEGRGEERRAQAAPGSTAATSPTETPCIPTELSPASVELVRLYEEIHTFRNDPDFIFSGFGWEDGPYFAWLQAIQKHRDTRYEMLDELGFQPNEVMMLGMKYVSEEFSESDLAAIEYFEGKIQAGLAAARCTELGSVQETIQAALEARRSYVAEDKEAQILARVLGKPVVAAQARREAWADEVMRATEAMDAHIAEFQAVAKHLSTNLSVENYLTEEVRGQVLRLERAIDVGEADGRAVLALLEAPPELPILTTEEQASVDNWRSSLRQRLELTTEERRPVTIAAQNVNTRPSVTSAP